MDNSTGTVTVVSTEVEPCRIRLDIEVPAERTQAVFTEAMKTVGRQARVPGFRPGKAPRKLLLRHYGNHVEDECTRRLVNEAVKEALDKQETTPETVPKVENEEAIKVIPGQSLVFSVSYEIQPQFDLPDYKGITVSKKDADVGDEQVDEILEGWLRQQASFEAVDRPTQAGDLVKVSYSSTVDESTEVPADAEVYLNAEEIWLTLADPELIPGTVEALQGLRVGEEKHLEVTFPDSFNVEALAGETARYHFRILEVHGSEKPELTDELVQSTGAESVGDLRERVRERLRAQEEQQQEVSVREQILNALLADLDLPLPPARKTMTVHQVLRQLYGRQLQSGTPAEQLESRQQELHEEAEKITENQLKRFYVFQRIAQAEDIQADPAVINQQIRVMAQRQGVTPKVMVRRLRENGSLDQLVVSIQEEMVMARLIELANVVDDDNKE